MTVRPHTVALLLALLSASMPSGATLDQDEASVETDRRHMNARRSIRADASYRVHEIRLDSGTMVREYLSPSGRIFAVTWHGPTLPDLRQIMGEAHFQTFVNAADARHVPRRLRSLRRDDLVVHSAGRPRAFSGHAYVPSLVPRGVAVESLR